MTKETPEQRKARFLALVATGEAEFREHHPPLRLPPPPEETPEETPEEAPPIPPEALAHPEQFTFVLPRPTSKSMRGRKWEAHNLQYDPVQFREASRMAEDLGIHMAQFIYICVGLVVDPRQRTTETTEILRKVKANFS